MYYMITYMSINDICVVNSLIKLYKGGFMNLRTQQEIDMYMQKVTWYSVYVDCLSRLIHELIENGNENLKPADLPNLSVLLEKLSYRLRILILKMASKWEFDE